MGTWYDVTKDMRPSFPPHDNNKINPNNRLPQIIYNPLQLNPNKLWTFAKNYNKIHKNYKKRLIQSYTRDIIDLSILHHNCSSPVWIKLGDRSSTNNINNNASLKEISSSYPIFGKTRDLQSSNRQCININSNNNNKIQKCNANVKDTTIIWPMNRIKEYAAASMVPTVDIPYEQKISKLVWRGKKPSKSILKNIDKINIKYSGWKQRHALITKYKNSTIIDVKYTNSLKNTKSKKSILRYKYVLSIESSSISSSFKWMLFSNSLLFLPKPITYMSYAMENLLQPFVHYIPVKSDMSNVEEMVQWAEEHPGWSKQIAIRGTLFIWDLLFHEDSYKDEEDILIGIMERYEQNFGY